MTDDQIINLGLIELLIKRGAYDEKQAEAVRKARADDSKDELLSLIRRWLAHHENLAKALEQMPKEIKAFVRDFPN